MEGPCEPAHFGSLVSTFAVHRSWKVDEGSFQKPGILLHGIALHACIRNNFTYMILMHSQMQRDNWIRS